jgi:hypothetical protein
VTICYHSYRKLALTSSLSPKGICVVFLVFNVQKKKKVNCETLIKISKTPSREPTDVRQGLHKLPQFCAERDLQSDMGQVYHVRK